MSPRKISAKANIFSTVPKLPLVESVKKPQKSRRGLLRRVASRRVASGRVVNGPVKDSYIPLLHPRVVAAVSFWSGQVTKYIRILKTSANQPAKTWKKRTVTALEMFFELT